MSYDEVVYLPPLQRTLAVAGLEPLLPEEDASVA